MARILIIEDDADLVQLLSLGLFRAGYEVHYAFNGKEGYEKILSLHPDLILLDLMMPILAGTDVMRMVSENVMIRGIPIIVMTAYGQGRGDEAKLLESSIRAQGAREYIRKPFQPQEMFAMIKRVLRQRAPEKDAPPREIIKGVVRLDPRFRTVWISNKRVATLSPKRAKVLQLLLESKGPVKRVKLISAVWGEDGKDNLLEKTIQRLREDLGPEESQRLQTRASGYELIG